MTIVVAFKYLKVVIRKARKKMRNIYEGEWRIRKQNPRGQNMTVDVKFKFQKDVDRIGKKETEKKLLWRKIYEKDRIQGNR